MSWTNGIMCRWSWTARLPGPVVWTYLVPPGAHLVRVGVNAVPTTLFCACADAADLGERSPDGDERPRFWQHLSQGVSPHNRKAG